MSGIEIAGLVLAVIPLFIAAAEQIQGHTKSRKAIKDAAFAGSYKLKLTQQQTLLGLYIKSVIGRTSLSASTQAELVDDLRGEIWERPEVVKAITQELGDAHQPFVELLNRTCSTLALCIRDYQQEKGSEEEIVDLLKNISLESQEAAGSEEKKARLWKKIKLTVKSSDGKVLLGQLDECNQMLERLSRAAFHAKPYEKTQQARRAHMTFRQRGEAERLFHVLRKACSCQNGISGRGIALRLQAPLRSDDGALESRFQMLLFDSQHAICELSAYLTRLDGPEPMKKKARISLAGAKSDTTLDLQSKNMKILGEICSEAKQAVANNSGLQIYVDNKDDVYSQLAKPTLRPQTSTPELLSLASVMSKLHLYEHKKWLHREKSILAVTLAYSLLRLHQSPWLQAQWDSNSISFIEEQTGQATERFKLRRPFTRSQVSSAAICCQPADTKPLRRNAHLHALGVVLLELYLNRSIEADVQAQIQTYGSADYRGVAIDLLEEHADDMAMTIEYNRATRFCLSPHPNPFSGSFGFEDQGFREIFYNEVIVNLEDNLRARFEVADNEVW